MRFQLKSLVVGVIVIAFLGLSAGAFAQNGLVRTHAYKASGPGGTSATTTLTLATGNIVTEVILCASAAVSVVEIYDTTVTSTRAAAITNVGATGPKIIIKVAVDEDSRFVTTFDLFSSGIFVYVSKGEAIIKRLAPI